MQPSESGKQKSRNPIARLGGLSMPLVWAVRFRTCRLIRASGKPDCEPARQIRLGASANRSTGPVDGRPQDRHLMEEPLQAVALQRTIGFLRQGHLDQPRSQSRLQTSVAEMTCGRASSRQPSVHPATSRQPEHVSEQTNKKPATGAGFCRGACDASRCQLSLPISFLMEAWKVGFD